MLELAKDISPQVIELPDVSERKTGQGPSLFDAHLGLIQSVKVRLSASLGSTILTIGELSSLKDGAVLKLDRNVEEPVDIVLEGKVVARGRLVAIDDSFGVSITEISPAQRP